MSADTSELASLAAASARRASCCLSSFSASTASTLASTARASFKSASETKERSALTSITRKPALSPRSSASAATARSAAVRSVHKSARARSKPFCTVSSLCSRGSIRCIAISSMLQSPAAAARISGTHATLAARRRSSERAVCSALLGSCSVSAAAMCCRSRSTSNPVGCARSTAWSNALLAAWIAASRSWSSRSACGSYAPRSFECDASCSPGTPDVAAAGSGHRQPHCVSCSSTFAATSDAAAWSSARLTVCVYIRASGQSCARLLPGEW
mmetsp:Transcript_33881/g.74374  ORF Transcript_33881/g.74374 Transcript_33881/m.74374 type:complete len:272 (+) Transcript_33881:135-950(+)